MLRSNGAAPAGAALTTDDPVAAAVAAISPARMEEIVRTLVLFGTRSTISTREDRSRGIGAAAAWLRGYLQQIADETGGRLSVGEQTFVHPEGGRLPEPT